MPLCLCFGIWARRKPLRSHVCSSLSRSDPMSSLEKRPGRYACAVHMAVMLSLLFIGSDRWFHSISNCRVLMDWCVCVLLLQLRRMSNNTVILSGTFIGTSEVVCGSVGETLKFTIFDSAGDGKSFACRTGTYRYHPGAPNACRVCTVTLLCRPVLHLWQRLL
jgi:hypothetical protein